MPAYPANAIPLNLNEIYTHRTVRDGRVVPVEMTNDSGGSTWHTALADNRSTLIRIRSTQYDAQDGEGYTGNVDVLYARTVDEKVALLLDARDDDVVLFAWPGKYHQDIFAIGDVAPALQALGLRPAVVEPIRDASGREWFANDTVPISNQFRRARALNARSQPLDLDDFDDPFPVK
jgi:hypothetical protein